MPKLHWRTMGPFVLGVLIGCGGKEVLDLAIVQILKLPA